VSDPSLLIYGNIASGKSTIARSLADQLNGYRYVCLDDTRKELWIEQPDLGAGQRDLIAQDRCLEKLHGRVVFENTAVTRFFKRAKEKLRDQELVYIYLYCPVATCLRRYNARLAGGKIQAPFAWGKYSIEQSMYYFDARQKSIPAAMRIHTGKVRPEDAVRFILEYLNQ
jgi:adenylate kinase family enzyme